MSEIILIPILIMRKALCAQVASLPLRYIVSARRYGGFLVRKLHFLGITHSRKGYFWPENCYFWKFVLIPEKVIMPKWGIKSGFVSKITRNRNFLIRISTPRIRDLPENVIFPYTRKVIFWPRKSLRLAILLFNMHQKCNFIMPFLVKETFLITLS